MGKGADGHSEGPGQSEIGDLDGPLAVDQQVLGLKVTVDNSAGVTVVDTI